MIKIFKKYCIFLILIHTFILNNFIFSMYALAEGPVAFGEMKASGAVQIESSTGKWVEMQDVYPLLKNTKLRTGDGLIFITTREGSRIDLSRGTEVTIDAMNGSYSVNLVRGSISFNVAPTSTLNIDTKQANISIASQVAGYHSLVAGYGAPSLANTQGMVFNNDKGTLIRSNNGRIEVVINGLQPRTLNTGESLFAALEGNGNKGIIGNETGDPGNYSKLFRGLIIGTFFTTATITAFDAFRGTHGVASPSGY
jgi:hypothetical protein